MLKNEPQYVREGKRRKSFLDVAGPNRKNRTVGAQFCRENVLDSSSLAEVPIMEPLLCRSDSSPDVTMSQLSGAATMLLMAALVARQRAALVS